jgi:hypothetical protein
VLFFAAFVERTANIADYFSNCEGGTKSLCIASFSRGKGGGGEVAQFDTEVETKRGIGREVREKASRRGLFLEKEYRWREFSGTRWDDKKERAEVEESENAKDRRKRGVSLVFIFSSCLTCLI